jgi:hypothetical protein
MSKYLCIKTCLHNKHYYEQGRIFEIADEDIGVAFPYFEKIGGGYQISKEAAMIIARRKIDEMQGVASLSAEKVQEMRELLKFVDENK